jgi:hypothetical protein
VSSCVEIMCCVELGCAGFSCVEFCSVVLEWVVWGCGQFSWAPDFERLVV